MRIQGKRNLQTVSGSKTRPTASRVREAIFNIWQFEIAGCSWLDLCAGTGAMGAEALCRRAALVVGIEQSSKACTTIKHNWNKVTQPNQQVQILQMDVLQGIKTLSGQQFDRIYFDPPYASSLYEPVLEAIATHNLLKPTGVLATEHRKNKKLASEVGNLQLSQIRSYGNTSLSFYIIAPVES